MRRLLLAVLLIAIATRATADEPARFFIEHIEVRGARFVSPDVIVAESRLRESRTYTESELREAAARLSRVAYLLFADFALEKGSERGQYVLIIAVNETRPFFFRLDAVPINKESAEPSVAFNAVSPASDNDVTLGVRYFVGRRGEVHGGLEGIEDQRPNTTDYISLIAGYTQYDVFGTRGFLTVNLKKPLISHGIGRIVPQAVAGIPLSINQTVAIEYDPTDVVEQTLRLSQRIATVRWSFNTTNHPLLPTRGTYIAFAPIAVWHDEAGHDTRARSNFILHDHSLGVEASANHWWELPGQNSAGAGVAGGFSRIHENGVYESLHINGPVNGRSHFGTLSFSATHSFWTPERVAREGDSRLQLDLKIGTRSDRRNSLYTISGHTKQVSLSWIRRTNWGVVRLGSGYSW